MPELSITRILILSLVALFVMWYLRRGILRLLDLFAPKLPQLRHLAWGLPVLFFTFPLCAYLIRQFTELRESEAIYGALYLSSVFGFFVVGLAFCFFLWDVVHLISIIVPTPRQVVDSPLLRDASPPVSKRIDSTFETDTESSLLPVSENETMSRRMFLTQAVPGAAALVFPSLITGYSVLNNRTEYRVHSMVLEYPNLPSECNGLKIAQVSDIHSGIYMSERKMEEIVETVNSLSPDLVALTGDFIAGARDEIRPFVNAFKKLKSPLGTYSCSGNHDEWLDIAAITTAMNETKLNLLRNEHRHVRIGQAELTIIGMDFFRNRSVNYTRATSALRPPERDRFTLLLCHHPDFFEEAKYTSVDLMLAGHTHGGQIALDFPGVSIYPIDLFYKYSRGLYEEIHTTPKKLYVNLGIGITGTPLRTVHPEIALITLTTSS